MVDLGHTNWRYAYSCGKTCFPHVLLDDPTMPKLTRACKPWGCLKHWCSPLLSAQHDAIFGRRGFENNKPLQVTHTHTLIFLVDLQFCWVNPRCSLFNLLFAVTSAFSVDHLIHLPSAGHISMAAGYLLIWRVQFLLPQSPKVSFVIIMNSQCRLAINWVSPILGRSHIKISWPRTVSLKKYHIMSATGENMTKYQSTIRPVWLIWFISLVAPPKKENNVVVVNYFSVFFGGSLDPLIYIYIHVYIIYIYIHIDDLSHIFCALVPVWRWSRPQPWVREFLMCDSAQGMWGLAASWRVNQKDMCFFRQQIGYN
jgi:hypothetical protein